MFFASFLRFLENFMEANAEQHLCCELCLWLGVGISIFIKNFLILCLLNEGKLYLIKESMICYVSIYSANIISIVFPCSLIYFCIFQHWKKYGFFSASVCRGRKYCSHWNCMSDGLQGKRLQDRHYLQDSIDVREKLRETEWDISQFVSQIILHYFINSI